MERVARRRVGCRIQVRVSAALAMRDVSAALAVDFASHSPPNDDVANATTSATSSRPTRATAAQACPLLSRCRLVAGKQPRTVDLDVRVVVFVVDDVGRAFDGEADHDVGAALVTLEVLANFIERSVRREGG